MITLETPAPTNPSGDDLEALIEEARRRARRRRWTYAVSVAIGALLMTGLYFAISRTGDSASPSDSSEPSRLASTPPREVLARDPYMGLSCPTPNSFACDRIGLAVWLRDSAADVKAFVAGQSLDLSVPESFEGRRDKYFTGFLQPAGLVDGPIKIEPDSSGGRWIGRDPFSVPVRLKIVDRGGQVRVTEVEIDLMGGYG